MHVLIDLCAPFPLRKHYLLKGLGFIWPSWSLSSMSWRLSSHFACMIYWHGTSFYLLILFWRAATALYMMEVNNQVSSTVHLLV